MAENTLQQQSDAESKVVPETANIGDGKGPDEPAIVVASVATPAGSDASTATPVARRMPSVRRRRWVLPVGGGAMLAVAAALLLPHVKTALNTISTDDAYVNGHVTFVAPRVSGQVERVLVDDNVRV